MDTNPEHWFWMLVFVTVHAVPAYLIYGLMMASDGKAARRRKLRPHLLRILGTESTPAEE